MLLREINNIDDDMGTQLPTWVKVQHAKKVNAGNERNASRETKSVVAQVKKLLVLMYPRSRQFTNYRTKTVTVKIDRPHIKDSSNPRLADDDAYLFDKFGVEKRTVGGNTSVIYHIPYSNA